MASEVGETDRYTCLTCGHLVNGKWCGLFDTSVDVGHTCKRWYRVVEELPAPTWLIEAVTGHPEPETLAELIREAEAIIECRATTCGTETLEKER